MFEKNYKNAMDCVKADANVKAKILEKIENEENKQKAKNPAVMWRIAFAVTACIAIVFGVMFIPKNSITVNGSDTTKALSAASSYSEIYKIFKAQKTREILNNIIYQTTDKVSFATEETAEITGSQSNVYDSALDDGELAVTETEYSGTTEQVEGVSEADIVKTDGEYIYYLTGGTLNICSAQKENSSLVSKTVLSDEDNYEYSDMFLKNDRLIILQTEYCRNDKNYVSVIIYDITEPEAPRQIAVSRQEGFYNSSRMVGDYVYLISNCYITISNIKKDDPTTYVPVTECNDETTAVPADSIYRYDEDSYDSQYTVIGSFNYKDGSLCDTASLLGGTDLIYCSKGNIILANTYYYTNGDKVEGSYSQFNTTVSRLEIDNGKVTYKSTGEIDGELNNQFYIDEYNGYFRFVTTVTQVNQTKLKFENSDTAIDTQTTETSARLTVLDADLNLKGEIKDLAKGEEVYSVRFMGDTAYFVTFRQTDPLFSADLSDPENPKIIGELKIPGFSEYMYPYGDGLMLGFGMDADEDTGSTNDLKLSMFNINDPANVTEEDKTVIEGYTYSPALNDHKVMLVSASKNLIGFAVINNYGSEKYMIYEYTGEDFVCKAELDIPYDYKNHEYVYLIDVRGLFIDDSFYLISDIGLQVYDMNTFSQLSEVDF